jgi:hypothetical protein
MDPLVLNLVIIETTNYGNCGDNSDNYDYDGNDDDADDNGDENKIIRSVIFYSLHHCLKT